MIAQLWINVLPGLSSSLTGEVALRPMTWSILKPGFFANQATGRPKTWTKPAQSVRWTNFSQAPSGHHWLLDVIGIYDSLIHWTWMVINSTHGGTQISESPDSNDADAQVMFRTTTNSSERPPPTAATPPGLPSSLGHRTCMQVRSKKIHLVPALHSPCSSPPLNDRPFSRPLSAGSTARPWATLGAMDGHGGFPSKTNPRSTQGQLRASPCEGV